MSLYCAGKSKMFLERNCGVFQKRSALKILEKSVGREERGMVVTSDAGTSERVSLTTLGGIFRGEDAQVLHASYRTQKFSKHFHDAYALGIIERGALECLYRGRRWVFPRGSISHAMPGEPHTGQGALSGEGWSYRMFYLPIPLVCHAAEEAGIRGAGLPALPEEPVADADLLGLLRKIHQRSLAEDALLLEKQEGLLTFLAELFRRYGKKREIPRSALGSSKIVRVAEYLRCCCDEAPSTEDLAVLADLSPYHMIRSFSQTFGMPPHAYLLQARVERARRMLEKGASPAEAAQATGFADQSHLHRYFRRILGIPPGAYQRAFRK